MTATNMRIVYFSATYTTRKIVRAIAQTLGFPAVEHDITCSSPDRDICINNPDELLLIGVPVYAGRIPVQAADALRRFKGKGAPAIVVCVYGNRDYDDALVELVDIAEQQGFRVFAAGAFIAQHSIFPKLAENRPDERDMLKISAFAKRCLETLATIGSTDSLPTLYVKGNRPYKAIKRVPLQPKGSKRGCNNCGICSEVCPTGAIGKDSPSRTDKTKCISCGRCVAVCPHGIRHFGGLLYAMAGKKLMTDNARRKEPDWFLI